MKQQLRILFLSFTFFFISFVQAQKTAIVAQKIIDKSIDICGGNLYDTKKVSFFFRKNQYLSKTHAGIKTLERISVKNEVKTRDVMTSSSFKRLVNDKVFNVPDSMVQRYANSINSVHYFSRLPYGLNDAAVIKELLGTVVIKEKEYYKVKVTFDQKNGGTDFDDTYIYWFNKKTYKPDYLAYKFHVDGGGIRFREAYNERYVEGIRFVDYLNFKANKNFDLLKVEELYTTKKLKLLSKIELEKINVE